MNAENRWNWQQDDWPQFRFDKSFLAQNEAKFLLNGGLVLGALEGVPGEVFANGLLDHIAGLVVGFLVAYPFYAMGGLKAGDGKYLMAVGALRGLGLLLGGAVYGALLGGVIALGFIAVRRLRPANGADATMGGVMKTWIPYGVALGLGTLVALALELSGRFPGATM